MYIYPKPIYNISINTIEHTLSLYIDNELFKTYPVAVGKPSTPSPKGVFTIVRKALNPGGPFGVRWIGLSKRHYGIHGTNNPNSIGKDISHGCIRLYNEDVSELYDLVLIGDTVEIM